MTLYRDGTKTYRSSTTYYRGLQPTAPASPGIDLDRLDYIRVYVVDKYGNRLFPISAAVLNKVVWTLNDTGTCEVDLSKFDPGASKLALLQNELQIVFTNTTPHEIWWGFPVRTELKPNQQTITLEGLKS